MPKDTHWLTHVKDAALCREYAEKAYASGNIHSYNFWIKQEGEKAMDAIIAKKRQEKGR